MNQNSRQVQRRELFDMYFSYGKVPGAAKHSRRPITGFDEFHNPIRGPREVFYQPRRERRNLARAYAAGAWRKIKAS